MAANNLGTAYIKIAPQMEGIQGAITKGLQSAAKSSVAGSTALGTVVAKGMSTAMNAVTNSMDRAIARVDTLNAFPKIMKNLGFSTEESTSAIEKLSNRIEGLPTGLDEIVNYTQRLASTMGNLNKGVYNATNLAIAFNDAALAGGKGQYEANRAFEQFSQVLSRGRPSIQDWKIMMEVMPGQLKQMARYMGSNNKSLQEYAKNAKKTVDQLDGMDLYNWISENKNEKAKERLQDLTKALIDLDNNGGAGITSFKEQVGDATHTIGNALRLIPLRISKGVAAIIQAFGTQDIYNVVDKFSSSFGKIADWIIKYMVPPIKNYVIPALKTVFGAIANIFKMIGENETASNILAGVIYAFVGFKAIKSVFPIIKTAGTVVGNLASKLNIFKGAQTLGNGIGSIVASILKPLGSTEVLKGAASAALVAGGIWVFADGIAKVSSAYIDWGKVALMEVNMAAITAVIAAIGALAGTGAIVGGVATAVISGGLWLFATALADLTLKLETINWEGIYALTGHIAVISTILSSIVALEALGAVGSIADAIIGGGLLVAAAGLAKASEIADSIDVDKISRLSFAVAEASIVLGALLGLETFGAVGAICDMVISGGLLVSAIALQETQNHVSGLNAKTFQELTDCLGQVSSALAIASTWSWAGAIGAIFNDAIDGGVLVAALALEEAKKHIDGLDAGTFQKFTDCLGQISGALAIAATWSWASAISAIFNDAIAGGLLVATTALEEASKHVRKIKEEDYQKLSRVFKEISSWETGGILSSFQKMVASNELTAVAWNIKNTLDAFAQMGETPDEEKINKLKSAIENLSRIEVHGSGLFENKGGAAQELEWVISNIVSINHKMTEIVPVDMGTISSFVNALKMFSYIDDRTKDGINRLKDAHDGLGNIDWIKYILGDVPADLPTRAQYIVDALNKLAGFNAKNISFESISTAVATLLNAIKQALVNGHQLMIEAGKQLAYKVRDGIVSDLDALMQAGKNIQSAFWVAIEAKLNDEYQQGRALANHVKDGINSIINSGELQRSGANAGNGLINGLKSTYFTAYNAGRNLASKLIQGIKDRGAEGSPWKTTFQSGIFAGQGLANGLLEAKDDVVRAAEVVADATQDALGLDGRGFSVGSTNTHLSPQTALTSGMNGSGGQVIQNNEFYVDSELDVKDVSKRLGWQVATAL